MKDHTSAASTRQAVEPDQPRFGPLELPSAPFWVVIIAGFIAISVVLAAASALFVFAIGVALSFFLVPVVNWLVRHGVPRIGASILVVAVLVLVTLVGLGIVTLILVEQGAAFIRSLPRCSRTSRPTSRACSCRRGSRTRSRPWRPRSMTPSPASTRAPGSSASSRGCWAWSGCSSASCSCRSSCSTS